MKEDDRPDHVVEDDPSRGVARSLSTHRKCVHTKKGVCSIHGPRAKYRWRPGTERVTVEDGVMKTEKTKIYYWLCDLGPKGRGLQQTGISRFLSSARGGREGNQTFGDRTLLGAMNRTTEGRVVVQTDGWN